MNGEKIISIPYEISLHNVSELIQQFSEFKEIFSMVFLRYFGKTETITLEYRLRTYNEMIGEKEFLKKLLTQYIKTPIQIPSNLYSIDIYDKNSTENFALDSKYFIEKDGFNFFILSELLKLNSEYISIIINSKAKLSLDSLISTRVSIQEKVIAEKTYKYEFNSLLKISKLPDKFQCIDVPLSFNITLNHFIEYFIPKKFLIALKNWFKMGKRPYRMNRKQNEYYKMIFNKYRITPLKFNEKIRFVLSEMWKYIYENYNKIIKIENVRGYLTPKLPKAYIIGEERQSYEVKFKFTTNFDNNNYITKSFLIFNFKWMKKIFKKYF